MIKKKKLESSGRLVDNLAIRVIMKVFEITMIDVLNKLEKMGRIDESMKIFFNKLYSV